MTHKPWPGLSTWPNYYKTRFAAEKSSARNASLVLSLLTLFGTLKSCIITAGLVLVCAGIGAAIAVLTKFAVAWQLYSAIPLLILIGAFGFGISGTSQQLRPLYEPGSIGEVVLKNGKFIARLNGHPFVYDVNDVRNVRRFGRVSAIIFRPFQVIVIPSRWVPHHIPGSGRETA